MRGVTNRNKTDSAVYLVEAFSMKNTNIVKNSCATKHIQMNINLCSEVCNAAYEGVLYVYTERKEGTKTK